MATRILVLATKNENWGATWPQDFFLKVELCTVPDDDDDDDNDGDDKDDDDNDDKPEKSLSKIQLQK